MDSGSEGNSDFSGQWTDGWSSSEFDKEDVSKGLESPSRVGKESEPVERVDVFGEGDEGGRVTSSESPGRSGGQIRDSIKDDEGNVVRKFFYCNRQGLRGR
ncbi:hypothetical protein AHAS_Ahas01G0276500 [Arachis hypogaea]